MARTKSKKNKGSPRRSGEISGTKPKADDSQDKSGSSILQNLMREVKAKTRFTKTLVNPEGELSISDAISKIIAPYRDDAQDYDAFYKLVMLACTAWNASIMPVKEREKMLKEMQSALPDKQTREDFMAGIVEFTERKNRLYPHVNRMVVKFKVTDRGDDFHIAVASTLGK